MAPVVRPHSSYLGAGLDADWRIGAGTAIAAAIAWGLIAGSWTLRGPLTTSEAIRSIVISSAVGAIAGLFMRSRWAILLSPVVFATAFELTRIGTDGPTVDTVLAQTSDAD